MASMFTIKLQNDKKNPTLQVPDSIRKKYIKQVNIRRIFVGDNFGMSSTKLRFGGTLVPLVFLTNINLTDFLPTGNNIYHRKTATSGSNVTMDSLK